MSKENGVSFLHFCLLCLRTETLMSLCSEKWAWQWVGHPLCYEEQLEEEALLPLERPGSTEEEWEVSGWRHAPQRRQEQGMSWLNAPHVARQSLFSGMLSGSSRSWVRPQLLAVWSGTSFASFWALCWWQLMYGDMLLCHPIAVRASLRAASNSLGKAGAISLLHPGQPI